MKSKLTSRKFWLALAAFVVGVLALFKVDANTTTQISGIIMSLGAVIAYIVGEGLVDASAASAPSVATADSAPVVATVQTDPVEPDKTGTAAAAQVKADTSLPTADDIAKALITALTATATQTAADSKVTAPADTAAQAAAQA